MQQNIIIIIIITIIITIIPPQKKNKIRRKNSFTAFQCREEPVAIGLLLSLSSSSSSLYTVILYLDARRKPSLYYCLYPEQTEEEEVKSFF